MRKDTPWTRVGATAKYAICEFPVKRVYTYFSPTLNQKNKKNRRQNRMCYLFVSRHGSVQMSSHFFFPKQRRCHTQMRHFFVSCDRVYACICATHSPACMSVCQRLTCINVFSHVFDFLTHKYVCLRARYARIYIHIYMNTYSYI